MAERRQADRLTIVEIRLLDGGSINARFGADEPADLARIQRELSESEFVCVGDDTIVRSADVRSIQLGEDSRGLVDSLMSRVGGESHAASREERGGPQQARGPAPGVWAGPDFEARSPLETKPFFLTSEFLLAFAAWLGLLLTALASDAVDGRLFGILTAAIAVGYMLARGFAKANTPSYAWDPREEFYPAPDGDFGQRAHRAKEAGVVND